MKSEACLFITEPTEDVNIAAKSLNITKIQAPVIEPQSRPDLKLAVEEQAMSINIPDVEQDTETLSHTIGSVDRMTDIQVNTTPHHPPMPHSTTQNNIHDAVCNSAPSQPQLQSSTECALLTNSDTLITRENDTKDSPESQTELPTQMPENKIYDAISNKKEDEVISPSQTLPTVIVTSDPVQDDTSLDPNVVTPGSMPDVDLL